MSMLVDQSPAGAAKLPSIDIVCGERVVAENEGCSSLTEKNLSAKRLPTVQAMGGMQKKHKVTDDDNMSTASTDSSDQEGAHATPTEAGSKKQGGSSKAMGSK